MFRHSFFWIPALALAIGACSESTEEEPGTGGFGGGNVGGTAGASTGGGGGGAQGGNAGSASGGSAGTATGGAAGGAGFASCGLTENTGSPIVVNEISSQGSDWVELLNTGSAAIDITDMMLADVDSATGCPKLDEALTFPSGASIQAGEHLLIVAGQPGAPNMLQTSCLGGPPTCYHVPFGLSGSNGDQVFLLSATSVEAYGAIPANAAASGESWCRIPDGSGAFQNCASPTPGSANQ